ncbi:ribosome maturation factor RimM [Amphibiibacter pelophylacis]|uniref:Ribosome maturation factor RimM n=1 Tax=Amphibiibacter pelophylacis TaxID=1799477 RepID=A0ACC6NXZ3_9BURK
MAVAGLPSGLLPLDAQTPWPDDAVEVACITGAWGVKGGIRIKPWSSDPQALLGARRWYLQAPEAVLRQPQAAGGAAKIAISYPCRVQVAQVKPQGEGMVATLREVADRAIAEALRGARIFVSRAQFPSGDPDEYYWVDLIGLEVLNQDGQRLGTVHDLMSTGPSSVLEVHGDARQHLIPFVAQYVLAVDVAGGQIRVDWPEDFSD